MFTYYVFIVILSKSLSCYTGLNVGTALFYESDIGKPCWSPESIILLHTRHIMQDLIPNGLVNPENDMYIIAYINYVHNCLNVIRNCSTGINQQLMILAIADIVGGYLRSYLLPMTKLAYYAGNIRYEEAKKLFTLFEEIKVKLKTNGSSWKLKSHVSSKCMKVKSLYIMPPSKNCNPCKDIIYNKKNNIDGMNGQSNIMIPIPLLDDGENPHAVAVPLKPLSLFSLDAPTSHFIIVRYYTASIKCMLSQDAPQNNFIRFNGMLSVWLHKAVLPHFDDEKWYPAFGGILRILETMKRLRMDSSGSESRKDIKRTRSKSQDDVLIFPEDSLFMHAPYTNSANHPIDLEHIAHLREETDSVTHRNKIMSCNGCSNRNNFNKNDDVFTRKEPDLENSRVNDNNSQIPEEEECHLQPESSCHIVGYIVIILLSFILVCLIVGIVLFILYMFKSRYNKSGNKSSQQQFAEIEDGKEGEHKDEGKPTGEDKGHEGRPACEDKEHEGKPDSEDKDYEGKPAGGDKEYKGKPDSEDKEHEEKPAGEDKDHEGGDQELEEDREKTNNGDEEEEIHCIRECRGPDSKCSSRCKGHKACRGNRGSCGQYAVRCEVQYSNYGEKRNSDNDTQRKIYKRTSTTRTRRYRDDYVPMDVELGMAPKRLSNRYKNACTGYEVFHNGVHLGGTSDEGSFHDETEGILHERGEDNEYAAY